MWGGEPNPAFDVRLGFPELILSSRHLDAQRASARGLVVRLWSGSRLHPVTLKPGPKWFWALVKPLSENTLINL